MNYYGTRLTENISRRDPEGYLLCLNVPVARIGTQEYLPEELGVPGDGLIKVYRPEEEVFSAETMASFEGMPVTNDHPDEGVDISNIRALGKGHAHNIRRGSGEESDLLLADLIIYDQHLIDLILEQGKREISCGYTYELCYENGQYIQRQIRGNHVAVVDAGRAGHRVCIKDHEPERERSKFNMKKLAKMLARMAKDGDIETVAEIIEEMIEPEAANPAEAVAEAVAELAPAAAEAAAEEAVEDPAAVVETAEGNTVVVDEEPTLADVLAALNQIIALLTPAATDEDPVEEVAEAIEEALEAGAEIAEEPAEDPIPEGYEEVAEVISEILDPEEETAAGDECDPDQPEVLTTGDSIRIALQAIRPTLQKMPANKRKKLCGDIAARLAKQRRATKKGGDAIARLASAKPARQSVAKTSVSADLGRKIMAARSANRPHGAN